MSYDYNALVSQIAEHRRKSIEDPANHLQEAVDAFATLSSHCPMTPLLWMQYALDISRLMILLESSPEEARETRLQTLELALSEFSGCALLRLHYLELLMEQKDVDEEKIHQAFQEAIAAVGRGSHRNEGELVASIYRLYVTYLASHGKQSEVMKVWIQRAETPMKDANDSLVGEVSQFSQEHPDIPMDLQKFEEARRYASKTFDFLINHEDEVDVAMHAEGILTRHAYPHDNVDWKSLLQSESSSCWMGLGGAKSAAAFVKYAQACARYAIPKHEQDDDEKQKRIRSLAVCVYERGVSECPTVESLWLSYLRHLQYLITSGDASAGTRLESAASRAVRNCPYSIKLYQEKIKIHLVLAQAGRAVLDPDALMTVVLDAINSKFLPDPSSQLELYMTAIQTVKRRILSLLASNYDAAVDPKKQDTTPLGDEQEQEVQDLAEDLKDMYDAADERLRNDHKAWSQGRTAVWKDRAMTERILLGPLSESNGDSNNKKTTGEALSSFDKLVKVHQPPHPDHYAAYIQATMNQPVSNPRQVVCKLQTARFLFQKALRAVGKSDTPVVSQRDRATALHCLCHDYLEFEQVFGSDESYREASKSAKKKLESLIPRDTSATQKGANKRKHSEDTAVKPTAKKPRTSSPAKDVDMATAESTATNAPSSSPGKDVDMDASDESPAGKVAASPKAKESATLPKTKGPVHKVRVGKLEYPAHPFTVRVTNLANETDDMDLVDAFRPKCGAVVHAKIVREKHFHGRGRSKGWGLVQFEERESVEKALELNDVIGIHERLIKVDRSHVPAVGLVPPGMHRVNPKGEGKSSKRNQRKRERKQSHDESKGDETSKTEEKSAETGETKAQEEPPKAKSSNAGILAFRPRGVTAHRHNPAHRKMHLSVKKDESS